MLATVNRATAIPSYARQTKLPCRACHTQFLELNDFGRQFKLNGYVLRAIETIEDADSAGRSSLSLNALPIVSVMALMSSTRLGNALPGTLNNSVQLPDQLSVFLAGAISNHVGSFVQVTYDPQDGTIGLDNTEFRYGTAMSLGGKPLFVGLSANNNPTMSDLWNASPTWGFPFAASGIAPAPTAAALVDGGLGGQVAGLTAFGYLNSALYVELGGYRASPLGQPQPLDSTAEAVAKGMVPYWRLALTHEWGSNYLMVGTYGLSARLFPGGGTALSGPTDRYTDVAADAQYVRSFGDNTLTIAGTWIHESRTLDAAVANGAASLTNQALNTLRARATYRIGQRWAFTASPFTTTGDTDATLYAPGDITGSANGSPKSSGVMGEVDYNAWQNVRVGLQYTAYSNFNGGSSNYDGAGRNASDNNTLYCFVWLLY